MKPSNLVPNQKHLRYNGVKLIDINLFSEGCEYGFIRDEDGYCVLATETEMQAPGSVYFLIAADFIWSEQKEGFKRIPDWATHVVWWRRYKG